MFKERRDRWVKQLSDLFLSEFHYRQISIDNSDIMDYESLKGVNNA
jgi:hypothetical protein